MKAQRKILSWVKVRLFMKTICDVGDWIFFQIYFLFFSSYLLVDMLSVQKLSDECSS